MKQIAHLFSREIVSKFFESRRGGKGSNFELMATLLMQRVLEKDWGARTMIGFYMTEKYKHILDTAQNLNEKLFMEALENGIEQRNPVDFIIGLEKESGIMEFQLKRFGLGRQEQTTDKLLEYLSSINAKYANTKTDATCLVALTSGKNIDFPRIAKEFKPGPFPFSRLAMLTVIEDKELVLIQIYPEEGWTKYALREILLP